MEKTREEDNEIYIENSRKMIDSYIHKKDYRKAFAALILVLERLDDGKQKIEFIDYYSKNMKQMGFYS
jgi:hypothetical protein